MSARTHGRAGGVLAACCVLAACGGTNGLEHIIASYGDGASEGSAQTVPLASDGRDDDVSEAGDDGSGDSAGIPSDATLVSDYDRAVPERPPPRDAGALAVTFEAGPRAPDGTSPGATETTYSIFAAQGPGCLRLDLDGGAGADACIVMAGCFDPAAQGGTCEKPPDGAHTPATQVGGVSTFAQMCRKTLRDVLASSCASSLDQTPCLCGTADPTLCLAGSVPPLGPIYQDYVNDFGSNQIGTIQSDFTVQRYGAGMANALVQCALLSGCVACVPPPQGAGR